MANICQKCGVTGYAELLVYCNICRTSSQHRYCMETEPAFDDANLQWSCEECIPSPRKSCTCMTNIKLDSNRAADRALTHKLQPLRRVAAARRKWKLFKKAAIRSEKQVSNTIKKSSDKAVNHPKDMKARFSHDADGKTLGTKKMNVFQYQLESHSNCIDDGQLTKRRRKLILSEHDQLDEDIEFNRQDGANYEVLQNTGVCRKGTQFQLHVTCIPTKDEQLRRRRLMSPEKDQLGGHIGSNHRSRIFHGALHRKEDSSAILSSTSENIATTSLPRRGAPDETVNEDLVQKTETCVRKGRRKFIIDEDETDERQVKHMDQSAHIDNKIQATKSLSASVEGGECASLPLQSETCPSGVVMDRCQLSPVKQPNSLPMMYNLEHTDPDYYLPVQPIVDPIWSGCFQIGDKEYGPLAGHLSTRACERVWNKSRTLPPVLHTVRLSRLDAWPKSFETKAPTDDNIALFFFPCNSRHAKLLDDLLEDVIFYDHVLKAIFDDAELLIFASNILPEDFQRFQGKYYFWGVFRGRQVEANVPTREVHNKETAENAELSDIEAYHGKLSAIIDSLTSLEKRINEDSKNAEAKKDEASRDSLLSGFCIADGTKATERKQLVVSSDSNSEERDWGSAFAVELERHENLGLVQEFALECAPRCDDDSGDGCLNLFPVTTENIGMLSTVQLSDKVDLELGLSWHANGADGRRGCKGSLGPSNEENFGPVIL